MDSPPNTPESPTPDLGSEGLTSRIVEVFLKGNLSAMLVIISLIAGAVALLVTPREEEPQIIVPIADVHISVPGASAEEVERQVALRQRRRVDAKHLRDLGYYALRKLQPAFLGHVPFLLFTR